MRLLVEDQTSNLGMLKRDAQGSVPRNAHQCARDLFEKPVIATRVVSVVVDMACCGGIGTSHYADISSCGAATCASCTKIL